VTSSQAELRSAGYYISSLRVCTLTTTREVNRKPLRTYEPTRGCGRATSHDLTVGVLRYEIDNARLFLEIQKEFNSFDNYIWRYVNNKPLIHQPNTSFRATSPESDSLSKDLKKRGFKFLGSTIMYAHMQAMGLVNDHIVECFRYKELV